VAGLREVLAALVGQGGTVFDTAPSYGESEEVAGRLARELGISSKLFWATKVNVARSGGAADPAAARAQIKESFRRFGAGTMDLVQVHNLGDVPVQLGILKELKAAKRVRYVGVTCTSKPEYGELERVMRDEPLDFIGVDYAVDNRSAEETILPLAAERRIAVMVYAPFGRTRLFQRVGERPLPSWAADFDARSWAQFFIKYVLGHPAVTVVTPATSKARNMADNLGGGRGRLPDAAVRKRMADYVDALPPAGG
jgi:aryl-alcohol dehydrogenase-like predicted oxidoreductase